MKSPEDPEQRLRERLRREAGALAEQALGERGEVTKPQLERLESLSKLVDLVAAAGASRRPPWAPAIALAATLAIASTLLFARVGETEIELDATVSEASFRVASPQWLTESMNLSALGASGLRGARWPDALAAPDADRALDGSRPLHGLRVVATAPSAASGAGPGGITLPSIHLDAGARVEVRRRPGAPGLELILAAPAPPLNLSLLGEIGVEAPGMAPGARRLPIPASLALTPDEGDLALDLQPAASALFVTPLAIRELALERVDVAQGGEQSLVRRLSTVLAGHVRLVALNGEVHELHHGETLRFETQRGVLRELAADGPAVALAFNGQVRHLRAGTEDNPRDLMPTWLEWLGARHGLTLFWGASLYLFGLWMAVWRWWGGKS